MKAIIKEMFNNWNETLIWSCLQGIMGEIYTNSTEDAAMAILGDFAFYAGNPSEELLLFKPERGKQDFIIMVPQNEGWEQIIQECWGEKAKKVTRYAVKKEQNIFDRDKLQKMAANLPEGYVIKAITQDIYELCKEMEWSRDLVGQYKTFAEYERLGLGFAVVKDKELAAGASSYSSYRGGIEIQIDTQMEHRRKGLARACGAALILECLKRGLYPSWDAQNPESIALAEQFGYHPDHPYTAYEIWGY